MKRDILTIKCVAQKNYGNENKPNSTANSVMELCVLVSVLTTITLLLITNSSINIHFLVVTVSRNAQALCCTGFGTHVVFRFLIPRCCSLEEEREGMPLMHLSLTSNKLLHNGRKVMISNGLIFINDI